MFNLLSENPDLSNSFSESFSVYLAIDKKHSYRWQYIARLQQVSEPADDRYSLCRFHPSHILPQPNFIIYNTSCWCACPLYFQSITSKIYWKLKTENFQSHLLQKFETLSPVNTWCTCSTNINYESSNWRQPMWK